MTKRYFIIPALAAALLISAPSCKHSDESADADETIEAVEDVSSTGNFTVTLDNDAEAAEAPEVQDSTAAKKGLFAAIKGIFKPSAKDSEVKEKAVEQEPVEASVEASEDVEEEIQEEPAESRKESRAERKERKKEEKAARKAEKKAAKEEARKAKAEAAEEEVEVVEEPVPEPEPVEVKLDTLESGSVWNSISPMDLTMNPVKNFAQDWMALVVGKNAKEHNSMTIAWGTIGQLWNKPVVIVYVSEDRYTKHLLDATDTFSVIGFPDKKKYRDALLYIGSHSQKDEPDKTENAGLTIEHTKNGTPIIAEGNLAIECRKIYEDAFDIDKVPSDVRNGMYQETGIHHMYIGEIVSVLQKN